MNLLASKKLYKLMSLEDYELAKNAYIAGLRPISDADLSDTQKWDLIHEKFQLVLPSDDAKRSFSAFQAARKEIGTSQFNLALHDAVANFADFYFLYTTTDPRFILTTYQKARLLESILDAITTCETGITARFDSVLQLYRTDTNWITTVLSKARYNLVVHLQGMYVKYRGVLNAMSVHVLPSMILLAEQKGLGVKCEHVTQDPFSTAKKERDIAQFFNQHYPLVFHADYENIIVEILSEHLLFEMQELYCPPGVNWSTGNVIIPTDRIQEFNAYVVNRVAVEGFDAYSIGDLEPGSRLVLKNKADVLAVIRQCIRKKLVNEAYFIPFEQITRSNTGLLNELYIRPGIDSALLLELNEALMNYTDAAADNVGRLMKEHAGLILQYPSLLTTHLITHPQLLGLMPNVLRNNPYFVGEAIGVIDRAIVTAMENQQPIEVLTATLLGLARDDSSALNQLSPTLLSHQSFALELVKKDGLLIGLLSDDLQHDESVLGEAIVQNPLAGWYKPSSSDEGVRLHLAYRTLRESLPAEIQRRFAVNSTNIEKNIASQKKMEALLPLLGNTKLTTAKTAKLAQEITPALLIDVVRYRQKMRYPSLPYCGTVSMINDFSQALAKDKITHWDKGYGYIKRQACELSRTHSGFDPSFEHSAVGSLANTRSWYLAMARTQRTKVGSFENLGELGTQFKSTSRAIGRLLSDLLRLLATMAIGTGLVIASGFVLSLMPIGVPAGLLVLGLFLHFSAKYVPNKTLTSVAGFIEKLSFFIAGAPLWIGLMTVVFINMQLPKFPQLFADLGGSLATSMTRIFNTLFFNAEYTKSIMPTSDLKTRTEESILRLNTINTPSALKKATLLATVWEQIDADIATDVRQERLLPNQIEAEWARRLNQAQDIPHEDRTIRASFYQLASLRRDGTKPFDIPDVIPAVSRYRFFRTTSINMLPTVMAETRPSVAV